MRGHYQLELKLLKQAFKTDEHAASTVHEFLPSPITKPYILENAGNVTMLVVRLPRLKSKTFWKMHSSINQGQKIHQALGGSETKAT